MRDLLRKTAGPAAREMPSKSRGVLIFTKLKLERVRGMKNEMKTMVET